jgi:betaine lipid synthase
VSRFCHAFEVESGNMIGNCSPASFNVIKDSKVIPLLDIGSSVVEVAPLVPAHSTINITPPVSSFHIHVGNVGRLVVVVCVCAEKSSFSPGD